MNEQDFIITTDSSADLPKEYLAENNIEICSLTYMVGETEFGIPSNPMEPVEVFYEKMRKGRVTKTSQINPDAAYVFLKNVLDKFNKSVLHIAFSSALSGTCNSFVIAAERLSEEKPGSKIMVMDSLCASLGQGLFVDYALSLREKGKTLEETYNELYDLRPKLKHLFTVDDLNHLYRGGRVSKMSAIIGGMIGIKPTLHVDEGRLISIGKVRGRKNALDDLVSRMSEQVDKTKTNKFFISHGDCYHDALYVAERIKTVTGIKNCLINYVGPVIGSHSGPGTVALFFIGI